MKRENVHQVNINYSVFGRMLAVIMVIALMIGLIPSGLFVISAKADTESVLGDESNYDSVVVAVQVDGEDYPTVELKPGTVSKTIKSVSVSGLPEGAEFIKAVLVDDLTDAETEVKYIAGINNKTYYSLDENSDFATKLEEGQELRLVYGTRYWVTVNKSGKGSYELSAHKEGEGEDARYYVWSKEDLRIQKIIPLHEEDYGIESISYSSGIIDDSVDVVNNSATIPASDIRGDITLDIKFKKVSKYYISDVSYSKGLGNGGIANDLGESSFTASSNTHAPDYFKQRNMPTAINVSEGNSKTFYLYSNSNTGDSRDNYYELNMLRINGQEIDVSRVEIDSTVTETVNGMTVAITKLYDDRGLYWLDNKPNSSTSFGHDRDAKWNHSGTSWTATGEWNKKRTIYQIDVSDVHSDIEVEYNFKKKDNRELIIKDLRGITATAHAREKVGNGTVSTLGFPTFEYYFESQESNVYNAYYYGSTFGLIPSANLYLYQVKKGYNPYTVTSDVYYVNGNTVEKKDRAQLTDENSVYINLPDVAIYNANAGIESNNLSNSQKFNATFRKWGGNADQATRTDLYNDENYYDGSDFFQTITSGSPYLLTYIGEHQNDSTWYAIALAQNQAKNQQLYLSAHPYEFKIELDLDGGDLTDDAFLLSDNDLLIENASHSVEDPVTFLPDNDPVREGKIFGGWQLQKWNGSEYVDYYENGNDRFFIYQKKDTISVDEDLFLNLVYGESDDQRIRFKAIWDDASTATKTKVRVEIYTQVPDGTASSVVRGEKSYVLSYEKETNQIPGDLVLLNKHTPANAEYYTIRNGAYTDETGEHQFTKLTSESIPMTDAAVIPEENILRVYYDYKTVELTVRKVAKGKMRTSEFDIRLVLTKDAISEMTPAQVAEAIGEGATVSGNAVVYTKTYAKGESVKLTGIPYGWTYSIEETTQPQIGKNGAPEYSVSYSPSNSGTIQGDTTISVVNEGSNPGILTKKERSSDNSSITLQAWASGESYVEDYTDTTPIDFAIVVDQSDVLESTIGYKYSPTKKNWTVSSATSSDTTYYYQDPIDKQYWPVYSKNGPMYALASSRQNLNNTLLNGSTTWSLDWWCRINGGNFYVYDEADDEFYYLYFMESGFESIGSYHVKFFYVKDTRINHSNADSKRETAKGYYDAGTKVGYVTVGGKLEESYSRHGAGVLSVWSNSKYLDVPVYTQYTGANSLWYTDGQGNEHQIGKTAKTASTTAYYGNLYTRREVTRADALKESVTDFVQEIADNAAAAGVDHRVSLIGFAGNETPSYTTVTKTDGNITKETTNGTNKCFDYINTGLFYNDNGSAAFKNYKTINTNFVVTSGYNGVPTNTHYYVYMPSETPNINGYVPVVYSSSSGTWNTLLNTSGDITPAYMYDNRLRCYVKHIWGNWEQVTLSNSFTDGDSYKNVGVTLATNIRRFYTADYVELSQSDYQNSLMSANVSQTEVGKINPVLASEISMLKSQGKSYTSYGVAMANGVLYNATPTYSEDNSQQERKKVIVVFSAGEPGDGTYNDVVAKEALLNANFSKQEDLYGGADVFTVYLNNEDTSSSTAEDFMKHLSSEFSLETEEVYNSALTSGSTYYYLDGFKTYYVTTTDTTKQWLQTDTTSNTVSVYTPSSATTYYEILENGEISSTGTTASNLDVGKKYVYGSNSSGNYRYTMCYGYRWYDDDNYIVIPASFENDPYGFQFYSTSGTSTSTGKSGFALKATDASELEEAFEKITNSLNMDVTSVTLNGDNSYLLDIITPEFELPYDEETGEVDRSKIKVYAVQGVLQAGADPTSRDSYSFPDALSDDNSTELDNSEDNLIITFNADGTKSIKYVGFDYGKNYVREASSDPDAIIGKQLRIVIDGLSIPEGTVGTFNSNTDDAGIYKIDDSGDSMVEEFEMPSSITIDPLKAKVTLSFDGSTAQKFPVTFKLTKSDGETGYQGQFGDYIFDSDGEFKTSMSNGESKLFEAIPPDAILTVTVSDPGNAGIYYSYRMLDNDHNDSPLSLAHPTIYVDDPSGGDPIEQEITTQRYASTDITPDNAEGGTSDDTRELEIEITDNRRSLSITNYTVGEDGDNSYADRNKEFPILVTLKNGNEIATGIFQDINGREIEFDEEGHSVIYLKHGQTKGIYVPEGYTVSVEDYESPSPYHTVFTEGDETHDGSQVSVALDKQSATATLTTSDDGVTVTHSIDTPVPTSVTAGNHISRWELILIALVILGSTIAFLWMNKRRRKKA